MNNQESISSFQLSMLFLAYMTGSAAIIIPAPLAAVAGNGAWLSILIAMSSGCVILACILYLHWQFPGMTYIDYSKKLLGEWVGIVVALPVLVLLFIQLSNIVIDIGGFFKSTMLRQTPHDTIHFMFFLLAALTVRAGIEVMARMFVLLLISMFGFIAFVLIMTWPYYHPINLLPVMPDGIKPILHGAYNANGFPYAEVGFFAMLLSHSPKKGKYGRYMFIGLFVNGFILLVSVVCAIMATGPLAGYYKYTLYQLARLITFQEAIERVESVIGFSLIAGSYMKASISLYILNAAVCRTFNIQNKRLMVFPLSIVCYLLSNTMYGTELKFFEAVNVIWPYALNCLFILPLFALTAIAMVKQTLK